ncbi:hypothetical protein [Acetobacter sp. LMG 32666]|uniref:hypothetical protein n=1 Tax=Acetobacter sp. LMG 32666 TaxID=2959295 RepID=UPI0030C8A050
MMNRVKTVRRRLKKKQGSVVIEAALFFIVTAALLTGLVKFGSELNEYYQINALTDHVGQIVARENTVSSESVQAVLDDATSSNMTTLKGATLCVMVTIDGKLSLTVPSACSCSAAQGVSATSLTPSYVVVAGCSTHFLSSSIFPTGATLSNN